MSKRQTANDLDNDPFWNGTATRGDLKLVVEEQAAMKLAQELAEMDAEWSSIGLEAVEVVVSSDADMTNITVEPTPISSSSDEPQPPPLEDKNSLPFLPLRTRQRELVSAVGNGHDTVVKLMAVGFGGPNGQPQSKRNNVNKALVCLCKLGILERKSYLRTTSNKTVVAEFRYTVKEKA